MTWLKSPAPKLLDRHVLLIDDDDLVRDMLRRQLQSQGYRVQEACDGREGLQLLDETLRQVILLDLKMPRMDGIAFLRELQGRSFNPYSIIVLTGHGTDEDVELCYQLGVQAFLKKPLNFPELRGLLRRTFELLETTASLQRSFQEQERISLLLKSTLDSITQGVVTLDEHFCVQMLSAPACRMLEIEAEAALGKPAAVVLGSTIAGPQGVLVNHMRQGTRRTTVSSQVMCASGAIVPVELSIVPWQGGSEPGWLLLMRDLRQDEWAAHIRGKSLSFGRMISSDPVMWDIFKQIDTVAKSQATVLITGETGTGKELVAHEIHERSRFAQGPFHALNCAAMPANLLESELFGYERGAFTNAHQSKPGRLELANGGTLFLDEVGELPLELQSKLLRVLQEQSFERLGGTKTIKVHLRVIAATNRNLRQMMQEKAFREDLYYRLCVVPLHLIPLRQRLQDIPLLISSFLDQLNQRERRQVRGLSPEAFQRLMQHQWPGNIRELYHALEHAFAFSQGDLLMPQHLPRELQSSPPPEPSAPPPPPPQDEREWILRALEQTHFHQGKASALLGMHQVTLSRKMKKYGLRLKSADEA